MYIYISLVCLLLSETRRGHQIPGMGIRNICELTSECWELNPGLLKKQSVLNHWPPSPANISFWIKFLWTKQLTAVLLKHSLLCSSAIRYRVKHSLLQVYSLHLHVITRPYNCSPHKVKPTERIFVCLWKVCLFFPFQKAIDTFQANVYSCLHWMLKWICKR